MYKCEICGHQKDMNDEEVLVGESHLYLCEDCINDRRYNLDSDSII
ncbi:hypothetical protein [Bacillus sp. MUM 13]|nr:hypothetical protein [Bacillus sp. MUM 13]